jgi:hypothetical protein
MISLTLKDAFEFEQWTDKSTARADETVVAAHDRSGRGVWCVRLETGKYGKVVLLFTPNDKLLAAVNQSVPRSIKRYDVTEWEKYAGSNEQ